MAKNKKKNNAKKAEEPKKAQKQKQEKPKSAKQATKGGKSAEKKRRNVFVWLFEYLVSVRAELKRVVWPTRQKVIYLVGVVVVTLIFFATFTAIIDYVSSEGVVALDSVAHTAEPMEDFETITTLDTPDGEMVLDGDDFFVLEDMDEIDEPVVEPTQPEADE